MFQRSIVHNLMYQEELRDQRSELFAESDSITELFRGNSEGDIFASWTLEACEFFNDKIHRFVQKIIGYLELQNEILGRQAAALSNNNL